MRQKGPNTVPKSVAVIGAGPAGLAVAVKLAKAGIKVDVYEASDQVGGMAKTIELWGQLVDLGPHRFFSSDPRVNRFWLDFAETNYRMVNRLTRIYYQQKFFDYPLRPSDALRKLGLGEAIRCISSYLRSLRRSRVSTETFEDWVVSRFGRRLFEIFFKSYSEKLWGISCADLDSDFASQRIKNFSLKEAIKTAFSRNTSGHRTLVDEFAYPIHGTGYIYEQIAKRVSAYGGNIYLNSPIESLDLSQQPIVDVVGGSSTDYDHIISTMPLTSLVKMLEPPPDVVGAVGQLRYRNTILVYILVEGKSLFPDQWIYVHDKELRIGRISNFQNWVPEITRNLDQTILCLELWCDDDDELWTAADATIVQIAKSEFHLTGLSGGAEVLAGHVLRVPKCYPIYRTGYKESLKPVIKFLTQFENLTVIGRYGSFKYNNQDHSILMGLLAFENLIEFKNHDLWSLNSDYEYQESTRIASTGLLASE